MDCTTLPAVRPAAEQETTTVRRGVGVVWQRFPPIGEVLIIAGLYLGYASARAMTPTRVGAADVHATQVVAFEREWHIGVEVAVNQNLSSHHDIAAGAAYYYSVLHFLVTPLVLVWLWRRRPEAYGWLRSALAIASATALLCYRFWPLAPPRLAVAGTHDTLARMLGASHGAASLVNQYAAMPSLHVGWAVWCAAAVIATGRGQARFLAVLYPMATTAVVIGTANHYVVDAVAGAALVLLALTVTRVGGCVIMHRQTGCAWRRPCRSTRGRQRSCPGAPRTRPRSR